MAAENEEYNIFKDFDAYKKIELMGISNSVGMIDENFCYEMQSKFVNNTDKIIEKCQEFLSFCSNYNPFIIINSRRNINICGIMNYQLNYNLRTIKEKNVLESSFYPSITEHIRTKKGITTCTSNFHKIEENEFQKLGILYNLYDNLHKINSYILAVSQKNKCESICTQKIECAKIFNQNIDKCPVNNQSKFCKELEQFRLKYNDERTCNTCSEGIQLNPRPQIIQEEESRDQRREHAGARMDSEMQESTVSHSTSDTYPIIPTVSCITIGYTPVGTYLHSRIIRKKMMWNNLEEEGDESLLSNSEIYEISSENTPFHVTYHSM
ncbi:PIR Superfamily Protein [Plasmodium ovale wallikeri]|uniref:PIR Superfamily Protein n=1 Tax=Plasmodium ovale wallikeri TaxID=864142 RepID=A0A1A9AIG9_PLAOA|nr:PIR Superfamily Protein [Plasmodium ovale wallikeri]SBT58823.1 PIR Superfamily Protein [Plasmodium ovale wallikeri]